MGYFFKRQTITNIANINQKILYKFKSKGRKPNKIWINKGCEFQTIQFVDHRKIKLKLIDIKTDTYTDFDIEMLKTLIC